MEIENIIIILLMFDGFNGSFFSLHSFSHLVHLLCSKLELPNITAGKIVTITKEDKFNLAA